MIWLFAHACVCTQTHTHTHTHTLTEWISTVCVCMLSSMLTLERNWHDRSSDVDEILKSTTCIFSWREVISSVYMYFWFCVLLLLFLMMSRSSVILISMSILWPPGHFVANSYNYLKTYKTHAHMYVPADIPAHSSNIILLQSCCSHMRITWPVCPLV